MDIQKCSVKLKTALFDSLPKDHCPGALLVCILTSNETWRTRNVVRSSNGDCDKTTQHFAMMSAGDLFVGYMRSSMAS